jgi:glycosyltransferase involved in cell wall biosynthesis
MISDEQPLVTICIPTYNRPNLLKELLDSVLAQSYRAFEVIITDNSDNDETELLVRTKYSDNRVLYYKNDTNLGMSGNTLKVLGFVKGKYFTFTPDDDIWLSNNKLKDQVGMLEANKNIQICFSNIRHINYDGTLHARQFKLYEPSSRACNVIPSDSLLLTNSDPYFVNILTALIRAEMLELFKESWSFGSEEYFMWYLGGVDAQIGFCREQMVAHRDGEHNWDVPDGKGGLINYRNDAKKRADMVADIYLNLTCRYGDRLSRFNGKTDLVVARIILGHIGPDLFHYHNLVRRINYFNRAGLYISVFTWRLKHIIKRIFTLNR